jgi:hypothetical protein
MLKYLKILGYLVSINVSVGLILLAKLKRKDSKWKKILYLIAASTIQHVSMAEISDEIEYFLGKK